MIYVSYKNKAAELRGCSHNMNMVSFKYYHPYHTFAVGMDRQCRWSVHLRNVLFLRPTFITISFKITPCFYPIYSTGAKKRLQVDYIPPPPRGTWARLSVSNTPHSHVLWGSRLNSRSVRTFNKPENFPLLWMENREPWVCAFWCTAHHISFVRANISFQPAGIQSYGTSTALSTRIYHYTPLWSQRYFAAQRWIPTSR